jgi:hypothetical protein
MDMLKINLEKMQLFQLIGRVIYGVSIYENGHGGKISTSNPIIVGWITVLRKSFSS